MAELSFEQQRGLFPQRQDTGIASLLLRQQMSLAGIERKGNEARIKRLGTGIFGTYEGLKTPESKSRFLQNLDEVNRFALDFSGHPVDLLLQSLDARATPSELQEKLTNAQVATQSAKVIASRTVLAGDTMSLGEIEFEKKLKLAQAMGGIRTEAKVIKDRVKHEQNFQRNETLFDNAWRETNRALEAGQRKGVSPFLLLESNATAIGRLGKINLADYVRDYFLSANTPEEEAKRREEYQLAFITIGEVQADEKLSEDEKRMKFTSIVDYLENSASNNDKSSPFVQWAEFYIEHPDLFRKDKSFIKRITDFLAVPRWKVKSEELRERIQDVTRDSL